MDDSLPLEFLEVELLIAGVLIDDEQMAAQLRHDEALVKLTDHNHLCHICLSANNTSWKSCVELK